MDPAEFPLILSPNPGCPVIVPVNESAEREPLTIIIAAQYGEFTFSLKETFDGTLCLRPSDGTGPELLLEVPDDPAEVADWNVLTKFRSWCPRRNIKPRFGAVGQHGSIAVIEWLILTLKQSIRWLPLVPLQRRAFLRELQLDAAWYHTHRAHMSLDDRTPAEVYHDLRPASRQPRFEPRARWPRRSRCPAPVTLLKGQPGVQLRMKVEFLAGRKRLPVVHLKRAA